MKKILLQLLIVLAPCMLFSQSLITATTGSGTGSGSMSLIIDEIVTPSKLDVKIFGNPILSSSKAIITSEIDFSLRIYDSQARVVKSINYCDQHVYSLTDLLPCTPGIYYLVVSNRVDSKIKKLIVTELMRV